MVDPSLAETRRDGSRASALMTRIHQGESRKPQGISGLLWPQRCDGGGYPQHFANSRCRCACYSPTNEHANMELKRWGPSANGAFLGFMLLVGEQSNLPIEPSQHDESLSWTGRWARHLVRVPASPASW